MTVRFLYNPITGLDRPWGYQEFEAPIFQDNRHVKVVRLSARRTGRLYPQEIFLVLSRSLIMRASIRGYVSCSFSDYHFLTRCRLFDWVILEERGVGKGWAEVTWVLTVVDVFTLVPDFDCSSFESSLGWPAGREEIWWTLSKRLGWEVKVTFPFEQLLYLNYLLGFGSLPRAFA